MNTNYDRSYGILEYLVTVNGILAWQPEVVESKLSTKQLKEVYPNPRISRN